MLSIIVYHLDSVAEEAILPDGGHQESGLCRSPHLKPEMELLDHHVGHCLADIPLYDLCTLHLWNIRIPPGCPTVEGSEGGRACEAGPGSERCPPKLRQLFMHFRKERHWGGTRL